MQARQGGFTQKTKFRVDRGGTKISERFAGKIKGNGNGYKPTCVKVKKGINQEIRNEERWCLAGYDKSGAFFRPGVPWVGDPTS